MSLFTDVGDFGDFDMFGDFDPVDPSFAPMPRERANTWHGRPRDAQKDEDVKAASPYADGGDVKVKTDDSAATTATGRDTPQGQGAVRKATARRNAWGNLSYADLIARAIESSPEKRLTLAEIYAWMVENVPFFKDKGESNSSAGWKNSIRHNLSLHNRFMRVQNEGAGKSSWWVINPDNRTVKAPRRRALTLDNTKAQHLKQSRMRRSNQSDVDTASDDHESNHMGFFPRSPEFRGRVSSNASSIGRLSPIPATFEIDMDTVTLSGGTDNASFITWNAAAITTDVLTDSLAGIFMDDLKKPDFSLPVDLLMDDTKMPEVMNSEFTLTPGLANQVSLNQELFYSSAQTSCLKTVSVSDIEQDFQNHGSYPPPLHHAPVNHSGSSLVKTNMPQEYTMIPAMAGISSSNFASGGTTLFVGGNMSGNGGLVTTGCQVHVRQQLYKAPSVNDLLMTSLSASRSKPVPGGLVPPGKPSLQESYQQQLPIPWVKDAFASPLTQSKDLELPGVLDWQQTWQEKQTLVTNDKQEQPTRQRSNTLSTSKFDQNTLRQLLREKPFLRSNIQKLLQMKRQQLSALQSSAPVSPQISSSTQLDITSAHQDNPPQSAQLQQHSLLQQLLTTGELTEPPLSPMPIQIALASAPSQQNTEAVAPAFPNDLDLSYLNTESTADIECNIDQVIQHELTFGDDLDFSFDPVQPTWGSNTGSTNDSLSDFLMY